MNKRDGNIVDQQDMLDAIKMNKATKKDFIPVEEQDMTEKQKKTRRVSLKDTRSKLGRQLKYSRNSLCRCGSGKKYKRCCGLTVKK
jgi:uncharacterized protein YecA (UPF0149 family)